MCEECLTVQKLAVTGQKQINKENDGLEGKDVFIFMHEINSGYL